MPFPGPKGWAHSQILKSSEDCNKGDEAFIKTLNH